MKRKLSKASEKALHDFDSAAQDWGWTQDQGTGASVSNSEAEYNRARGVLHKRLTDLERHNKQLRSFKKRVEEIGRH